MSVIRAAPVAYKSTEQRQSALWQHRNEYIPVWTVSQLQNGTLVLFTLRAIMFNQENYDMKISEVMSQLREIQKSSGDIEVLCQTPFLDLVSPLPLRVLESGCEQLGQAVLITAMSQ